MIDNIYKISDKDIERMIEALTDHNICNRVQMCKNDDCEACWKEWLAVRRVF